MSNSNIDVWNRLRDEISSPWDWVAALGGAASGAAGTVLTGGLDMGSCMAAGALVAVTGRKAVSASRTRPRLRKRIKGFLQQIDCTLGEQEGSTESTMQQLKKEIQREERLWEVRAINDAQFEARLDELIDRYRQAFMLHDSSEAATENDAGHVKFRQT